LLCCTIENYCVASAQALDESVLKRRRACEERRKAIRSFVNRHQLCPAAIHARHVGGNGGKPGQCAPKFLFVPNIVLIAEGEVIRVDCWIVRERKEVCTDSPSRPLSDHGFLSVSLGEPFKFRYGLIVGTVIS